MATAKNDDRELARPASEPTQDSVESAPILDAIALQNEQHERQIAELKSALDALGVAFQASQARNAQDAAFQGAVSEIRQAARAMSVGVPLQESALAAPAVLREGGVVKEGGRGECGCDCTSAECCTFKIVLRRVRATRPQIEPPDMGDIPLVQNAMEVRIYATADGVGALIPSLASTLDLRADGLPPGPGPYVVLERELNRVQVKKGTTRLVELYAEVEEDDTRLTEQAALAGKNEFGEATGSIILNCCMDEIYPPMPLDVDLRYGGEGRGSVQLVIYAKRVCC